jgi:two-component system sensor histidine kinase AlgZ
VPPLVLQPLVENAVRHGVEPQAQGGRLWVQTRLQRGQAWVTVVSTLPAGGAVSAPGQGMALANVRERLHLLHDMAAQCDTWQAAGPDGSPCFHARIVVPAP